MDDYISKPFRSEVLAEVIDRWTRPAPANSEAGNPEDADVAGGPEALPLNAQVLVTLRSLPGLSAATLLEQVIPVFLRDARTRLDELAHAVEQGDLESVRRIAHALKGSAGEVGAHPMSARCAQLEQHADTHGVERLSEVVDSLEAEFRLVEAALVNESSPPPV